MKRWICAVLAACIALSCIPALALTGEEILGLGDRSAASGSNSASYPMLQMGSRDADDAGAYVVMLQNRLYDLGYLYSMPDGQFGQMTQNAVVKFQAVNGLSPNGIADDTTQSLLYSDEAQSAPIEVASENDLLRVQQALINWGFMTGRADGIEGDGTRSGIAEFKNYIYTTNARFYAPYATPAPAPTPTPAPDAQELVIDTPINAVSSEVNGHDGTLTPEVVRFATGEYSFSVYQYTVQNGMNGPEVWRVQRRLSQLRYLYKPDGSYGRLTEYAIRYFQRKNGLPETGIADQATQEKLFSSAALPSEEYVFPYKLGVSIENQRVYVWGWDGESYSKEVMSFACSTGMSGYDTPTGTYQSGGRVTSGPWYYFSDYNCYAKYAYRIVGGILFHSVLYGVDRKKPTNSSVNALGRKASHGCVRLPEDKAQWIFENCPEGTTVVIK